MIKSAIVSVIKDERRFLREWADYHLNIGFDHIYLCEDYESVSHKDILQDLIDGGKVTLYSLPSEEIDVEYIQSSERQYNVFCLILDKMKREKVYDYASFIDVDEFITFQDGYDLERLMSEYKDYDGVWLGWLYMTASGHIKRPEGGVIENYTQTQVKSPEINQRWTKKSIVRVSDGELDTVHTTKRGCDTEYNTDPDAERVFSKAYIRHYFTKSWEDFCDRMQSRGNFSNNFRTYDQFFEVNEDMQDKWEELIESVRYKHNKCSTWISRKYGIISGGNLAVLEELNGKPYVT